MLKARGGGEDSYDPHQRHASLGDGRPEGEPDADEGRPGDLSDQTRGYRFKAWEDPEPRREEQEQGFHQDAEEDGEPGGPQKRRHEAAGSWLFRDAGGLL